MCISFARKTIQTATYIDTVSQQLATRGPFLIIAPLSTIPHWYREFTGWTNLNTIVYHGTAWDRKCARKYEFAFPEDRVSAEVTTKQNYLASVAKQWSAKWEKSWMAEVVITTPEMIIADDWGELKAVSWEVLVVDEAHRLKNNTSKLTQNLKQFRFKHPLLLTGVRQHMLLVFRLKVILGKTYPFCLSPADTNPEQLARVLGSSQLH